MRRKVLAAIAVALVAGLAHVSALPGGYTFDDHLIVEDDPRLVIHDLASVRTLLASHYWGPASERSGERLYRPVPLATYALERTLAGGPAPRTSHATNVLLHALAAVLALALLRGIADERTALLAALLFAAHPLHAEAVAGIVGRAEVLALVGGLAVLLLHAREGAWARAGEALALFLALASKESAAAVIPIAAVLDLVRDRRISLRRFVAPTIALAVYVLVRAAAIGSLTAESKARTLGDMSLAGRSLYALAVLRDAWADLLLPFRGTSAHYPLPDLKPLPLAIAVLVQLTVLWIAGSFFQRWLFGRGPTALLRKIAIVVDRRERSVVVGLLGMELALSPVLNIIPIGVVYAERLLYAPSLWASLVVAALVSRSTRKPAGPILAGLIVGALVFGSLRNDRAWRDDLALWTATVRRFPFEERARLALGEVLLERGDPRDALANLRFAAERFPDGQPLKAKAYVRVAQALLALGSGDPRVRAEADRCLARAIALAPEQPLAFQARAEMRLRGGETAAAIEDARRACALAPESYEARWSLGIALLEGGEPEAAERELTAALALSPLPGEALFNRAEARWARGDRAGAGEDYVRAAECLVAKGKRREARSAFAAKLDRVPERERARVVGLLSG